jgi:hypothetical protein
MNITGENIPLNMEEFAAVLFAHEYAKHNKEETIQSYTKRVLSDIANRYRYVKILPQTMTEYNVAVTPDAMDVLSCLKVDEPKQTRDFTLLAQKMIELFPIGKKPGTSYLWRGNLQMITRRLNQLYEKSGAKFTDEEALAATEAYVKENNGNPYMRILKYFIFKNQVGGYGNELDSDLLSWIENIRNGGTEQQQQTLTEEELFY